MYENESCDWHLPGFCQNMECLSRANQTQPILEAAAAAVNALTNFANWTIEAAVLTSNVRLFDRKPRQIKTFQFSLF
jgi:hypothetical protein